MAVKDFFDEELLKKAGVGLVAVSEVVASSALGYFLGHQFHNDTASFLGLLLGMILGFVMAVRHVRGTMNGTEK